VSLTVTVNDAVPVLPCASVALHEIVLAPSGRFDPLGGAQVTATAPSTMSCAETSNVTGAPAGDVGSRCVLPGTVTTGAVVSVTVTVKVATAAF
jgi:hypothetical protein